MKHYDFLIVGGGIAGASAAARLAEHASVLVLEGEQGPGYHSTGRSAAIYTALYGNAAIQSITRASRSFFDRPPVGFCEYPLLTHRGMLFIGREQDAEAIEGFCQSPLVQRLTTDEALSRVSVLARECAVHCAYESDSLDIDVNGLHQGFLRLARSRGAEIAFDARVIHMDRVAGIWRVDSSLGPFQARVLVNAAGPWADHVAELAGVKPLSLQPLRRTAMIFESPDPESARWPAVVSADESFYFKPDAGMILASPADETPSDPCDAQPEDLDIAICADLIETRTKLQVKRVIRAWAGLRTFASDRTPIVGYDTGNDGFFWLAGQGGYGVQTAPALSDVASALALEHELPRYIVDEGFSVKDVLPERFKTAGTKHSEQLQHA